MKLKNNKKKDSMEHCKKHETFTGNCQECVQVEARVAAAWRNAAGLPPILPEGVLVPLRDPDSWASRLTRET